MTGIDIGLVAAVFAASAVEAVEAATIVLAMGITRGWLSALTGMAAGLLALMVMIAVLGPAIAALPLDTLRVIVGTLLLIFGLQWLRKAVRRAAGLVPLHDEDAVFAREEATGRSAARVAGRAIDPYGFAISFKGVWLEGVEVAFIVITFGANAGNVGLAAAAALCGAVAVAAAAVVLRGPLSRVPENHLKFGVGVMLCAFGMFWAIEGAGGSWPGDDLALVALVPFAAFAGWFAVIALRPRALSGRLGP